MAVFRNDRLYGSNKADFPLFVFFFLLVIISFAAGCVSVQSVQTPQDTAAKDFQIVASRINEINASLPVTLSCNVSVSGMMEGRPFKADGIARMSRDPRRARIQLKDPIFLAPALEIYADSSVIKFYFPVERVARVARGNFTDLNISGRSETRFLIAWMFSGEIPFIKNYTVDSVTREGADTIAVISNETVEQRIVMRGEDPYEVTLINKSNSLHYRVRYGTLYTRNEHVFFRSINAWSRTTGDRVSVSFSDVRFDRPISTSEFKLEIPPDVAVSR